MIVCLLVFATMRALIVLVVMVMVFVFVFVVALLAIPTLPVRVFVSRFKRRRTLRNYHICRRISSVWLNLASCLKRGTALVAGSSGVARRGQMIC